VTLPSLCAILTASFCFFFNVVYKSRCWLQVVFSSFDPFRIFCRYKSSVKLPQLNAPSNSHRDVSFADSNLRSRRCSSVSGEWPRRTNDDVTYVTGELMCRQVVGNYPPYIVTRGCAYRLSQGSTWERCTATVVRWNACFNKNYRLTRSIANVSAAAAAAGCKIAHRQRLSSLYIIVSLFTHWAHSMGP